MDPSRRWLKKEFGMSHRRNNIDATDTIHVTDELKLPTESDTNSDGSTKTKSETTRKYVQIFVEIGKTTSDPGSGYISGYPMDNKSDFPEVLVDHIRNTGIPKQLMSDGAKEEDSKAVKTILRRYNMLDTLRSEPEAQHQNPAEVLGVSKYKRCYKSITTNSKLAYDFDLPPQKWLYQSDYVIDLLNHRATSSGTGTTKWLTPIERRGEPTPDLSKFRFGFGEKVVFFAKQPFPRSGLRIGRSLGPAKEGNYLCQRILTSEGQVISRSAVESVANVKRKGLRLNDNPSTELGGDAKDNSMEGHKKRLESMMDEYEEGTKEDDAARRAEHRKLDDGIEEMIETAFKENTGVTDAQKEVTESTEEIDSADNKKQEAEGYYYVQKIIGRNDPIWEQVKRYPSVSDDSTKTRRNCLDLLVDWGEGHDKSYESFTSLKQSTPELVANYVSEEFGDDPDKQQIPCIQKAIKWSNAYLGAPDTGKARIQALASSGYFETYHKSSSIDKELRGGDTEPKVTTEANTTSIFKIGVDENARIQYGKRCPRLWSEALKFE